jgi:hypothetical protein
MRSSIGPLLAALALVAATAGLARADAILFATDATLNGVDGFCVQSNGALAPSPRTHVDTAGIQPRRLIVGSNNALYVVEKDRVEAFRIGPHGGLARLGNIQPIEHPFMNPFDAAVSSDGRMLYVIQNGQDRIAAFPLAADGTPAEDFTSCVQGPSSSRFQRLHVTDTLLYATSASQGGHVAVYPLTADANGLLQLQLAPTDCHLGKTPSSPTCPLSVRRRLPRARSFILDGDHIYIESLIDRRLFAFQLTNGLFDFPIKKKTGQVLSPCLLDTAGNAVQGPFRFQKFSSRTRVISPYQDIVLANGSILGSQFLRGRVDAYRLTAAGELPQGTSRNTKADVRGSPVGLAALGNTLYVAGGELDRVEAFHIGRDSGLPDTTPFSETDVQTNTFPNALAVAQLPDTCP